jgi:hypothetical protein
VDTTLSGGAAQITCQMQGNTNSFYLNTGSIVVGPATISVNPSIGNYAVPYPSYITVKFIPVAYNPNQTLIVPPGTNQVQITLQVSPDLVNWTTATNGVYGSPNTAQFFRISEQTLTSRSGHTIRLGTARIATHNFLQHR